MQADTGSDVIESERLVLRRSAPEDAEAISAYRSIPVVSRYQGWDRTDPDFVRAEIEEMAGREPGGPGGWVQFSVLERESDTLVGDVGISAAEGEPGVVKVGYTVAPDHQRKGYATEAVRALVRYAFEVLGATTVRAHASAENVPSIRVAAKVGMRQVDRFVHRADGHTYRVVRYEVDRDAVETG